MKKILLLCFVAILFVGCETDDDLTPSRLDLNWFVLEDSSNPIDHHRYEIYKKFDIPIYYNDTIGSVDRIGLDGVYGPYYERLQVFFSPGVVKPAPTLHFFKLVANEDISKIDPILTFLEKEVIPAIYNKVHIPSLLLVSELETPTSKNSYKGLNTVTIGKALLFNAMTEEEKRVFKGGVISGMLASGIATKNVEWLEENFYDYTYKVNPLLKKMCYSTTRRLALYRLYDGMVPAVPSANMRLTDFGFIAALRVGDPTEDWAQVPDKNLDVSSYIEVLFAYSSEELEVKYGKFPVVVAKLNAMKELLKEYGFTL